MPSLLDSFFIELGLDPSGIKQGLAQAETASAKARDAVVAHAKDMEHSVGDKLTDAFQRAKRGILEFTAAVIGARSAAEWTKNNVGMSLSLLQLSTQLGMTVENISSFQIAMHQGTLSTEQASNTLKVMNGYIQELAAGNVPPDLVSKWGKIDLHKNALENLLDTIQEVQKQGGTIDQQAFRLGKIIQDQDAASRLIRLKPAQIRQMQADAAPEAITKEEAEAALELQKAWSGLGDTVNKVGVILLSFVSPALKTLLADIGDLVNKNRDAITGWIGDRIKDIDAWIKDDSNWQTIRKDFEWFRATVEDIVGAVGGWNHALEILFGIFLLNRVMGVVGAIRMIIAALQALGLAAGAATGGSVLRTLFRTFALVEGALALIDAFVHRDPSKPASEWLKNVPSRFAEVLTKEGEAIGDVGKIKVRADSGLFVQHMKDAASKFWSGLTGGNQPPDYAIAHGWTLTPEGNWVPPANIGQQADQPPQGPRPSDAELEMRREASRGGALGKLPEVGILSGGMTVGPSNPLPVVMSGMVATITGTVAQAQQAGSDVKQAITDPVTNLVQAGVKAVGEWTKKTLVGGAAAATTPAAVPAVSPAAAPAAKGGFGSTYMPNDSGDPASVRPVLRPGGAPPPAATPATAGPMQLPGATPATPAGTATGGWTPPAPAPAIPVPADLPFSPQSMLQHAGAAQRLAMGAHAAGGPGAAGSTNVQIGSMEFHGRELTQTANAGDIVRRKIKHDLLTLSWDTSFV